MQVAVDAWISRIPGARERAGSWCTLARTVARTLAPGFATTEDVMVAANCSRRTIAVWTRLGLLPEPRRVSLGNPGGMFNRYPAWAIERARLVAQRRKDGYTYDEIRVMLAEHETRERGAIGANSASPAKRSRPK